MPSLLTTPLARLATRAAGAVVAGGASGGIYLYNTDDGIKRSFQAYSTFIPVIAHYRALELADKYTSTASDEDWEKLDERYAN